MRKPSDQSLEDKRVYVIYKSITERSQDRNSKTEFEGRLASYSISATLTKELISVKEVWQAPWKMLLAGRKAGLSLASFPIELKTVFLRNDTVHSGLHSIASINIEETPPPDQFNLDNVSIKIQYSVKVMIKANQNIFYSVKNSSSLSQGCVMQHQERNPVWERSGEEWGRRGW